MMSFKSDSTARKATQAEQVLSTENVQERVFRGQIMNKIQEDAVKKHKKKLTSCRC